MKVIYLGQAFTVSLEVDAVQGENQNMFPRLFTSVPWGPRHPFCAVFLAVLVGLLLSRSTGTCPIQAFISWELHSGRALTSQSIKSTCDCT